MKGWYANPIQQYHSLFYHFEQGTKILVEFKEKCGILRLDGANLNPAKPTLAITGPKQCVGENSCLSKKTNGSHGI